MWTLFWGFKEVTEDGISQAGLTNRTSGMNNLQGISIVDGNFDQRGAGLRRLRCLSEITLVDLCPSVPAPAPHAWSAQGSWPQCFSEGWVSRVMPVSQRLQLSFHSSCTSVFWESSQPFCEWEKQELLLPFTDKKHEVERVSSCLKVSQEGIAYPGERQEQFVHRESQSYSCRQEAPGRRRKHPELWVSVQEPLWTKVYYLDGDPYAFPFSPHLCHGNNIKFRVKRM